MTLGFPPLSKQCSSVFMKSLMFRTSGQSQGALRALLEEQSSFPPHVRQLIYERAGYLLRFSQAVTRQAHRHPESVGGSARLAFSRIWETVGRRGVRSQLVPTVGPRLLRTADALVDANDVLVANPDRSDHRLTRDVLLPHFALATELNYRVADAIPEPTRPLAG